MRRGDDLDSPVGACLESPAVERITDALAADGFLALDDGGRAFEAHEVGARIEIEMLAATFQWLALIAAGDDDACGIAVDHHPCKVTEFALNARGISVNAPVRTAMLTPSAGLAGTLPPFVGCEDRNIVVETVKKAEDGNALIVRMYECHNARGRAELFCARPFRSAWLCDLDENPETELEGTDGIIGFDYRPFEIITLRLEV